MTVISVDGLSRGSRDLCGFQFNQRHQGVGESVTDVAELKCLAVHCDYQDRLEYALCDQLVCGLRSSHIQRRLLSAFDLTYVKAVKLATGMGS